MNKIEFKEKYGDKLGFEDLQLSTDLDLVIQDEIEKKCNKITDEEIDSFSQYSDPFSKAQLWQNIGFIKGAKFVKFKILQK